MHSLMVLPVAPRRARPPPAVVLGSTLGMPAGPTSGWFCARIAGLPRAGSPGESASEGTPGTAAGRSVGEGWSPLAVVPPLPRDAFRSAGSVASGRPAAPGVVLRDGKDVPGEVLSELAPGELDAPELAPPELEPPELELEPPALPPLEPPPEDWANTASGRLTITATNKGRAGQ